MKVNEIANRKRAFIVCICAVLCWIALVRVGERLPYLDTIFAQRIRYFAIFPLLTAFFAWFIFVHKWKESGKTGYRMRIDSLSSRRERIKQLLISVSLLPLLTAGLTWTSIFLSACGAYLLPGTPTAQQFKVLNRKAVGNQIEIIMLGVADGETAWLRLTTENYSLRKWKDGEILCAKGKSTVLGTIIISTTNEERLCAV